MLIKEVVLEVVECIKVISENPETALKDRQNLLYFEAQLAFAQLKHLLLEYHGSDEIADEQTLRPFFDFLSDRWKIIQNTDAVYPHRKSHINQICISLAKVLSKIVDKPVNKILIPMLNMSDEDANVELNKVVMSDDNSCLIDIYKCLETAHKELNGKLKHTCPNGGLFFPLSETERDRVIRNSQYSQRYYLDILQRRTKNLANDKTIFENTLGDNCCSTYSDQGWNTLENNLFNKITTREQLVNMMMELKPSDWEKFLDHIPFQKLNKIVLNGMSIIKVSQDPHSYTGNEAHDKVVSFLIIDNYRKSLIARVAEYNGYFGSWTGYSKGQKKDASLILYNYLRSEDEKDTLANLPTYLKKEEFEPHIGALTSTWDTLGKLTKQIELLGNPEYRKDLENKHKQELERIKHSESELKLKYSFGLLGY